MCGKCRREDYRLVDKMEGREELTELSTGAHRGFTGQWEARNCPGYWKCIPVLELANQYALWNC